jgi:uncharacterized cupin superfamily protein
MEKGFSCNVRDAILQEDELNPAQILSGNPKVASLLLGSSADGKIIRGIWSCTAGTVTDVEQDEMFTVIDGRATVSIEDGPTLELFPGVTGLFQRGAKTTWVVHEKILKTYQITFE